VTVRFHSTNRNEPQRRSPSLQYAGRWITAAIEIDSAISPAVIEVMESQPIAAKAIWHRQFSGHGLGLCPDPHVVGSSARALRPSGAYGILVGRSPFFPILGLPGDPAWYRGEARERDDVWQAGRDLVFRGTGRAHAAPRPSTRVAI
jgi:hypothetical protein